MTNKVGKWKRVRFKSNEQDYRPIYKVGPWWCSGQDNDDNAILIAYVNTLEILKDQWPEAFDIEVLDECETPTFSARFPKPDWWTE